MAMSKHAGQQMTTGAQAESYEGHLIADHLVKIGGGETYSHSRSSPWRPRPTLRWRARSRPYPR